MVKGDLYHFLKLITDSFICFSEQYKIKFETIYHVKPGNHWFDPDKLDRIISNLVSNAFKYTRPGGHIKFELDILENVDPGKAMDNDNNRHLVSGKNLHHKQDSILKIQITDNGTGIPGEEINKIFNSFYQSNNAVNANLFGVGLGLSLAKELVNILRGELYLESSIDGTTFLVLLPVSDTNYSRDEISNNSFATTSYIPKTMLYPNDTIHDSKTSLNSNDNYKNKLYTTVLIVEDNVELLNFLEEILESKFNVLKAMDGQKALEITLKNKIDLVISDIMIPGLDGIELCKRIKQNKKTSHIPIILLTAKRSEQAELDGLEIGADDYIMKPFNPRILLSRIHNIIESRNMIRQMYSQEIELPPKIENIIGKEKHFLDNFSTLVEKNLSNSDFFKKQLYLELGMSKTQVYKKLKYLNNQTVNEYIRNARLKKAAQILQTGKSISVTELAYAVGFTNVNYFTQVFGEYHGISPTLYHAKFLNKKLKG